MKFTDRLHYSWPCEAIFQYNKSIGLFQDALFVKGVNFKWMKICLKPEGEFCENFSNSSIYNKY